MLPVSLYKKRISLEPRLFVPLPRKPEILLADRNEGLSDILSPKLEEQGYLVLSRKNKLNALCKIKEYKKDFPLVISNILDSPMDGFDFEKVAQLIHLPDDHVIAMFIAIGKGTKRRGHDQGSSA